MTQEEAVKHWLESAERDFEVSKDMVQTNHRDWALFIGQLSLEKLLKGLVVKKTNQAPPFIHDLIKLSQLAGIEISIEQMEQLAKITRFHVAARYVEIKSALYKEATPEFTAEWMKKIGEFYLWFKKLY